MSERRFASVDFTHISHAGCLRHYEAGHVYVLPRVIANGATTSELVTKQHPTRWAPPTMFRPPKVLTTAEVVEAEAELKALPRHALEVVDPPSGEITASSGTRRRCSRHSFVSRR
jgi:hypothetical protein